MFDVVALCDDRGLWPPVVFGWVRRVRWARVVLASMVGQQCVAQDGHHVEAMLGGGRCITADLVAVSGAVFAGEAPGDVLLHLAGP